MCRREDTRRDVASSTAMMTAIEHRLEWLRKNRTVRVQTCADKYRHRQVDLKTRSLRTTITAETTSQLSRRFVRGCKSPTNDRAQSRPLAGSTAAPATAQRAAVSAVGTGGDQRTARSY